MTIFVEENQERVVAKLMKIIASVAEECIAKNSTFNIGLSGGSLATFLCDGLPTIKTDFSKWKLFFCDERIVEENSPDSTFGLYKKSLIDSGKVPLKEDQFVKIKQGLSAKEAAEDYTKQMQIHFSTSKTPEFDLLLLGMGPDGHTCSLFPGHKLLEEKEKWIASITDSPKPPPSRITMTYLIINSAKNCIFALCGEGKAEMVKRILVDKEDLPSTKVKPSGNLYWIVDKAAGKHIK